MRAFAAGSIATCAIGLASAAYAPALGCGRSDCDCSSAPGITIDAPSGAVSDVTLSGPACDGALPSCALSDAPDYPPGCATTFVFARNAGECDVEIDFLDGRIFHRTVTLVAHTDDCCTTIVADTSSSATIDVPDDAAADAHE